MEFRPHENWKRVGPFVWLTVHYDHRFVRLSATQTRLVSIVAAEGLGASIFGRLFAKLYRKNLEKAIPLLVSLLAIYVCKMYNTACNACSTQLWRLSLAMAPACFQSA